MAKSHFILTACTISILLMFCVMSYLMYTIKPPVISDKPQRKSRIIPAPSEPSGSHGQRAGVYFDDAGVLPIVDTAQYGLEKIETAMIEYFRSTKSSELKDRKVIPPLWPRATQETIVNPTKHKVMPPIWPTTSIRVNTIQTSTIKTENPSTKNNLVTTPRPNKLNVKSMKRRSVSNYILDEDASSVILKILDYNGRSKIEIKVWSDSFIQKMKEKSDHPEYLHNHSKQIVKSDNNEEPIPVESIKNTVVSILANDSIVVEDSVDSNITKLLNSVTFVSSKDVSNTNITNQVSPTNTTLNEDKSIKMIFAGNSSNSSAYVQNNSSNMRIKHQDTYSSAMKNSSDFDFLFDAQNNNTQLINKMFKDDVNTVTADTTVIFNAESGKISISDIYSSNYTDPFIENDSDIVY